MHFYHYLLVLCFGITAQAQTRTQCQTSVASPPPQSKIRCAEQGTLSKPKILGSSTVSSLNDCRANCLGDYLCKSFSFDTSSLECTTYKTSLDRQGFKPAQNGIENYHRACFTVDHCTVSITTGHYTIGKTATATYAESSCIAGANALVRAACSCAPCSEIPTPTGTDCPKNRATLAVAVGCAAYASCPVTKTVTEYVTTNSVPPMSSIPFSSGFMSAGFTDFITVRDLLETPAATWFGKYGGTTVSKLGYMSAVAQETHRA